MKKLNTLTLTLLFLILLTPVLQSCLDDNDPSFLAIATFRMADDNTPYFTLDEGEKMYPDTKNFGDIEEGQRLYVYFDKLDEKVPGYDYHIHVKSLEKILTKDLFVMDEETADSIGDDKINITDLWFGDGYLNMKFQYLGTHNPSELHMVNLVRNDMEDANAEEEEGYLNLEFRHNAYDDYPATLLNSIAAFKGEFMQDEIVGLKIRYNSIYDGVKYVKINFLLTNGKTSFLQAAN